MIILPPAFPYEVSVELIKIGLILFRVFAKMEKMYSCKCTHALKCWVSYNTTMMLPILDYGPPIHAVRTKYTWRGLYQDVEDYLSRNPLTFFNSEFLLYFLDQNLPRMSKECPITTSTSARVATKTSA